MDFQPESLIQVQGLRAQSCKLLSSFTSCSSCEEGKKLFFWASSSSHCTGPVLYTLKSMVKPWVQLSAEDRIWSFVHYESVKRSLGRRELAKPSQIQVVWVFKSLVTLPGAIANLLRSALFCRAWNCFCGAWIRMMTGRALLSGVLCLVLCFVFERKLPSLLSSQKS